MLDTSWTAIVVGISLVMYSGLPNKDNINSVGTKPLRSGLNVRIGIRKRYKVRIGTLNDGSLTDSSRELAEILK